MKNERSFDSPLESTLTNHYLKGTRTIRFHKSTEEY